MQWISLISSLLFHNLLMCPYFCGLIVPHCILNTMHKCETCMLVFMPWNVWIFKKEKNNRGTEKPKKENAQVIFPSCSAFISNWMPSKSNIQRKTVATFIVLVSPLKYIQHIYLLMLVSVCTYICGEYVKRRHTNRLKPLSAHILERSGMV